MSCPLYVDFTRMCVKKFPAFVRFSTFQICESEQYIDCPMYQICIRNYLCEYISKCSDQYNEKMPKLIQAIFKDKKSYETMLHEIWMKYCFSVENSKKCARYHIHANGETPPLTLMPDGQMMRPFDILFKRKQIIHIQE